MKMKNRFLVTGGAGYVGSHMVLALLDAGHEVTVFDSLRTGHRAAVPDGARFIEGDRSHSPTMPKTRRVCPLLKRRENESTLRLMRL